MSKLGLQIIGGFLLVAAWAVGFGILMIPAPAAAPNFGMPGKNPQVACTQNGCMVCVEVLTRSGKSAVQCHTVSYL